MNLLRRLRRLLSRFRRRDDRRLTDDVPPDPDDRDRHRLPSTSDASDPEPGLRDRLADLAGGVLPDPDDVAERGGERLDDARRRSAEWVEQGTETARDVARRSAERVRAVWAPEDPDRILDGSRLFEPLPGDPDRVAPELLSLRWRNEALLALSSAGVLSLEDEIVTHTDRLFHAGLPTPELSERIFGRDFGELHRWIDTVPGSDVAGGGITHRVEHGHDLEAAATIYEEHGLEGVLAWTQHVGQDAFSSTGVPVPAGGKDLAGFLVDQGYATKGNAALLVSFNAAELAAGFLAGAFAIRLATMLREMSRRRKVRKRCEAAFRARERGDLDAVIANYAEARSLADDPALSLALGWAYRETGRPAAEAFLEFRRAALELAPEDRTIDLDGAAVSLRGIAYLLALVEAPQVLERDDLEGAWRKELGRMVRGAVASFEAAAISQSERPGVSLGERDLEWRPRPLSAAANYYLAARSVAAVPFVDVSAGIGRLRDGAVRLLRRAGEESDEADADRIEAVAARWEAALADDVGLLAAR